MIKPKLLFLIISIMFGVASCNVISDEHGDPQGSDVKLTDEEFWRVAEEFGIPLDKGEGRASLTSCSFTPNLPGGRSATRTTSTGIGAYCYGYLQFPGDSEQDCFIVFNTNLSYTPAQIWYDDTNGCAWSAHVWYGGNMAVYQDAGGDLYLRMDAKWCKHSDCEDGFNIRY